METYKILVIEDDEEINHLLCKILGDSGFLMHSAYSGTEAKMLLEHTKYDAILLDLMLPGINGEELLPFIREKLTMPVIVISAKPGAQARITALRLGADDFITKPFENDEVVARVEAQLRRVNVFSKPAVSNLTYKNCEVELDNMLVCVKGIPIALTVREFQILVTFLQNPSRVFTRETLFTLCWKEEYFGMDNTIDVHISRIRAKLAVEDDEQYIETVRGIGYRLAK